MPIGIKVQSPTQGILIERVLFQNQLYYNMKEQKSSYDHDLYMMDNKNAHYTAVEAHARKSATNATNHFFKQSDWFRFQNEKHRVFEAKIYTVIYNIN